MPTDQQGLALSGASPRGAELFRAALDELVYFKSTVFATIDAAIEESPAFAMPYFAKAYLNLFMTEPEFTAKAQQTLAELKANVDLSALSEREQLHAAAVEAWVHGDLRKSALLLDQVGLHEPRDILALRIGHELDFFSGNKRNLRDRVARQLGAWSEADPHYGIVHGCYAFGLEENGQYQRAEEHGLIALGVRPDDVWALHAVTHSFEMRGAIADGISFMDARRKDWTENNLFSAHNWWHNALFNVDIGQHAEALSIYDAALFNGDSPKIALVLLDASSLLWRLHLERVDVGDRFHRLASAWDALLPEDSHYVFNDVHAVMAYVGADRLDAAKGVVRRLEHYLASGNHAANNYSSVERVGLPLAQGLVAFGEEDYDTALRLIYAVRSHAIEFGGSEAQRDVLDRTIVEASLRARRSDIANALASERVHLNPNNPYNWSKMSEALRLSNAVNRAADTAARSEALRQQARRSVRH